MRGTSGANRCQIGLLVRSRATGSYAVSTRRARRAPSFSSARSAPRTNSNGEFASARPGPSVVVVGVHRLVPGPRGSCAAHRSAVANPLMPGPPTPRMVWLCRPHPSVALPEDRRVAFGLGQWSDQLDRPSELGRHGCVPSGRGTSRDRDVQRHLLGGKRRQQECGTEQRSMTRMLARAARAVVSLCLIATSSRPLGRRNAPDCVLICVEMGRTRAGPVCRSRPAGTGRRRGAAGVRDHAAPAQRAHVQLCASQSEHGRMAGAHGDDRTERRERRPGDSSASRIQRSSGKSASGPRPKSGSSAVAARAPSGWPILRVWAPTPTSRFWRSRRG